MPGRGRGAGPEGPWERKCGEPGAMGLPGAEGCEAGVSWARSGAHGQATEVGRWLCPSPDWAGDAAAGPPGARVLGAAARVTGLARRRHCRRSPS